MDLTRNRNDDDFLLLYFSGHGQQAYDEIREEIRNTYLGTADFNEQDVKDDAHLHVSMHWLRDHLFEKTNAGRVLIILDCCFAEDIRTGPDHSFDKLREQIQYYFDIPGAEVKKRQAGCYNELAKKFHAAYPGVNVTPQSQVKIQASVPKKAGRGRR